MLPFPLVIAPRYYLSLCRFERVILLGGLDLENEPVEGDGLEVNLDELVTML
jgi:hypothetical protein